MKIGDQFKLTEAARENFRGQKNLADVTYKLIVGGSAEIKGLGINTVTTTNGVFFYTKDVQLLEQEQSKPKNYAAAFNAWQDDFINNPQAYEDSQTVSIRHLTEKLNGEEPSYGAVCAEVLVNYLNKLESN